MPEWASALATWVSEWTDWFTTVYLRMNRRHLLAFLVKVFRTPYDVYGQIYQRWFLLLWWDTWSMNGAREQMQRWSARILLTMRMMSNFTHQTCCCETMMWSIICRTKSKQNCLDIWTNGCLLRISWLCCSSDLIRPRCIAAFGCSCCYSCSCKPRCVLKLNMLWASCQ